MSRLNRADSAKSVTAVWRWLSEQPEARSTGVSGLLPELLARLGGVGNVTGDNPLGDRLRLMKHLGLIGQTQDRTYDKRDGFPILHVTTRVLVDEQTGAKAIATWFAKGGYLKLGAVMSRKLIASGSDGRVVPPSAFRVVERTVTPKSVETVVAVRLNDKEEPVEAIAGPDAPSPFESLRDLRRNEPAALVEAARQYNNRQDFVIEKLTEIEKMGVVIDREKVMKAIKLDRDDEMEGIVKVLPYIEELESRVKQALDWKNDLVSARNELRTARDEKRALQADFQRQQEANKRLAERMAAQTVGQSRVLVGEPR